jgi:hypothetical protein
MIRNILIAIIILSSCTNNKKEKDTTPTPTPAKQDKVADVKSEQKEVVTEVATLKNSDTLFITQKALVMHEASNKEVEKWRNENEENFGEAASDNLHYMDETKTEAEKRKIPIIRTASNILVFQKQDGNKIVWTRGKNYEGWGAIAFDTQNNPKAIEIVSAADGLKKYFK